MSSSLFYGLLYAGGIVFFAGCIVRAVRYSRQPIHLRWEIYPVPHGRVGELKIMIPEILFLKGLWEFNRPMWCVSFPFHFGLYLLAATTALLGCAAVSPPALVAILRQLYTASGALGALLALGGAMGLLVRRLAVRELRTYSSLGDYLNLLFFIATLILLLAGYWLRPSGDPGLLAILRGAATFDTSVRLPSVFAAGMAAGAILLAYIPMTHMAHFIAKYFTYHRVRWDEAANVPGGSIEKRMAEYLMYRPTWAAPHVGAEGRTWAEIATANPARGAAK
ncbi:MAG TPA: respiratory nitrate reductase subunit gamma [Bryobacteraceae bacterium]|nr:respiratory nitrate reductase subunit gamma [Bryobacteraceae bacterium]